MAPIKKRTSMRARAAAVPSKSANAAVSPADISALKLKKQDKRHLKHAALMHRVRDAGVSKKSSSGTNKRRRPNKKMQAVETLGGLRDALPSENDEDGEEEWEGLSEDDGMADGSTAVGKKARRRKAAQGAEGKTTMKSLQHRPGAMKRKAVLEKREQERFRRNLAQLADNEQKTGGDGAATAGDAGGGGAGQAGKWAALRAFIGGTMEREKAFGKG